MVADVSVGCGLHFVEEAEELAMANPKPRLVSERPPELAKPLTKSNLSNCELDMV